MPGTFNGIGTTFYGHRDYRPDGSYSTTEWLVFLYIPTIPLRSARVRIAGHKEGSWGPVSQETTTYAVYETGPPHLAQVAIMYAGMLTFFLVIGGTVAHGIARGLDSVDVITRLVVVGLGLTLLGGVGLWAIDRRARRRAGLT